jgi:hypothetical protein
LTEPSDEDSRLAWLTEICLALPDVTRSYTGPHAAFLVRDRKFAYYLDNHHGDGIVAVSCRAAPGENDVPVSLDPTRFYKPAYIGPEAGSLSAAVAARSTGTRSPNWPPAATGPSPRSGSARPLVGHGARKHQKGMAAGVGWLLDH